MPGLTVNGERREFPEQEFPPTLGALVKALGFNPHTLVAEVDGRIVRRAQFDSHALKPEQTVELLQLVGGG
jgi:thiamine biosynthesis protein ThiS